MKKSITGYHNYSSYILFFLISFFNSTLDCLAQNTFQNTGTNVGIGTTNPSKRLHLANLGSNNGIQFDSKFRLRTSDASNNHFVLENLTSNGSIYFRGGGSEGKLILNDQGGNVGIGTTSPSEKLDVNGKLKLNNTLIIDGIDTGNPNAQEEQLRLSGYGILGNRKNMYITNENVQGSLKFYVGGKHGAGSHLLINSDGFVGIGTGNAAGFKLGVNGAIRAKEIKVETGWSDFVFEKDYYLPTLKEVANHIAQKGHLKDIPSAAEVEKEGIFLGEMDSKLLQKIEELTLYLIAENKANTVQQRLINKQAQLIAKLEKRIEQLEAE
ncbi:hypothetical protein DSM03_11618 [Leeuwenhoekiella aestuarii]|uniref:hypothetical protein n=1 Tax=Leeuwenhoekiella aestuarii TaxID=2249426 RepID=UPI000FFEF5C5|nr:hypothetical protein [Leeuwenhoekiella aestuarii]RXG11487.1 hypothetical protein DSM03_11618 [Leeuwenhoekiella aestuarii]